MPSDDKNPLFAVNACDDPTWDGIRPLRAGQIDVLPECPRVFYWALRTHKLENSEFRLGARLAGRPVYVVFSATDQGRARAAIFDNGLRELRASGRLAASLANYGLDDGK